MELTMHLFGFVALGLIVVGAYWWGVLPQLRKLPGWDGFTARLWGFAGNSKTIAVAYAAELIGVMDEAKLLDWSALVGSEKAGRVMVVMGAVMIVLRLVTRTAVAFRAEER
jgi:hypothetical protein